MDPQFETQFNYRAEELRREAEMQHLANVARKTQEKRPNRNFRTALLTAVTRVLML